MPKKKALNINSGDLLFVPSGGDPADPSSSSQHRPAVLSAEPYVTTEANYSRTSSGNGGGGGRPAQTDPRVCMSFGYKQNHWPTSHHAGELLFNALCLVAYCSLYGCIVAMPHMHSTSDDHLVFYITTAHLGQFCILLMSFLRSTYWCALLKDHGYLRFPMTVRTVRKVPLTLFVISNCLLQVFLTWPKPLCLHTAVPCFLQLPVDQLIVIYLGVECGLICMAWLLYLLHIRLTFRRSPLPDVMQELYQEQQCLSASGNAAIVDESVNTMLRGEWSGPFLSVTDDTRLLNDMTYSLNGEAGLSQSALHTAPLERLHEDQEALLHYLRHRNFVLSQKLAQLQSKLDAAAGSGGAVA